MSNPAKVFKKVVKAVLVVAVIAAIAYVALPALSGAGAAGGASTAATGSFTAGASTVAATGGSAAAGAAATGAGTGLLGTLGAGAAKVGAAVSNASPMVKLGLINAGSQFVAGAMAPEEQTAAEQTQDMLNVYHSQPRESRTYSTSVGQDQTQAGYVPQAGMVSQPTSQYTPTAGTAAQTGLLGRYNPETRKWESA